MLMRIKSNALPALVILFFIILSALGVPGAAELPAGWQKNWENPPAQDRPMQIVHGIPPQYAAGGLTWYKDPGKGMDYYAALGLGGIVCNVAFDNYMQSEEHWQTMINGVKACEKLGLVVWIYDEEGYPSGGAGGLTLKRDPSAEALELAFDETLPNPFVFRPAYEHTHASNNYHAARRYLNLMDDQGVREFIDITHNAYWNRLQGFFGKTIHAFFTDEPSLIAVNLGPIPEAARKNVPTVDPINPDAKALPSVPWVRDLPEEYYRRFGEDIMAGRLSLFRGDSPEDRRIRRQFYALIAELTALRYFGQLKTWCHAHGVASSGHLLHEESIMHHPTLEGNALTCLAQMDIPGIDVLSSNPDRALGSGWLTAGLANSAAALSGGRRVMTEISDFSEKMSGSGPVDLDHMRAAAAWQAAFGVTEFTLYYSPNDRSAEDYRAYCEFVGRMNAILKPADYDRPVLLYYPVEDLSEEYIPVAEKMTIEGQSKRAQTIVSSFNSLGRNLTRAQIPFALIDHEYLGGARLTPGAKLRIGKYEYSSLVIPAGVELPATAARQVKNFEAAGGAVIRGGGDAATLSPERFIDLLHPKYRISPASDGITAGTFVRDGKRIVILANAKKEAYAGSFIAEHPGKWSILDPATGEIRDAGDQAGTGTILKISPLQTIIIIEG